MADREDHRRSSRLSAIGPVGAGRRRSIGGTPTDDIPERVAALESEVAQMRSEIRSAGADATAARFVAAGADRDLTSVRDELRAHTRVINALRQDHVEFREGTFRRFEQVDRNFAAVERQFAIVKAGIERIVGLLDRPAE